MEENEFIKGRWYKGLGSKANYYAKFDCLDEYRFRHTNYIEPNGTYHESATWLLYNEDTELADMTEVSKFLPEGHIDKVVNYKYTPEYCLNRGNKVVIRCESIAELKEVDRILGTNYSYFYSFRQLSHSFNVSENWHSNNNFYESYSSYDIIKATDFIKNNTKNMKDKKIIGYKLKHSDLLKAASKLTDCPESTLINNVKAVGYEFNASYLGLNELKKVNLFEEWLIPVFEEESINLSFGDTRVTVKKGQGFVSIQEGNISKADLKQIIDHFTKGPKMLGYTGEAVTVKYGCKSGLIGELVKIYEII